ncbi:hypothetical protein JTE90_013214 [Oedothorax gibbosus]|uniref:Uncharacterized protein n=1 Tax=Oedothorax gibbosus TaxID=931172 RepID=A0AAV6UKK9_9ARAC|nr:hypothetical protein JTE90_013214 [Oedothorax gibbosus]
MMPSRIRWDCSIFQEKRCSATVKAHEHVLAWFGGGGLSWREEGEDPRHRKTSVPTKSSTLMVATGGQDGQWVT